MKITLCGSITFYDGMLDMKIKLEQLGHLVKLPPSEVKNENGDTISVKEYHQIRKAETDGTSTSSE